MNLETLFVRDKKEFDELKRMVEDVFYLERRLPEQVFREQFHHYLFEEFDWAMGDEFWNVIQALAKKTKDDFVLTAVLDPDPVEYFYKVFHYYHWMKLPVGLSSDEYFAVLESGPKESPADAVLYNSFTAVWLPPSMNWAIWGERSHGVCILGLREAIAGEYDLLPMLKSWRPLDETVLSWVALNFADFKLPQDIADTLVLNYSIKKPCV